MRLAGALKILRASCGGCRGQPSGLWPQLPHGAPQPGGLAPVRSVETRGEAGAAASASGMAAGDGGAAALSDKAVKRQGSAGRALQESAGVGRLRPERPWEGAGGPKEGDRRGLGGGGEGEPVGHGGGC